MDRFEAARYLGLADTEVLDVAETEHGTAVRLRAGGDRLITREDGVFALTDHPSTSGLRRWDGSDEVADAFAQRPTTQPGVPVADAPAAESAPSAGHPAANATFSEGQALPNNRPDEEQDGPGADGDQVPDGNADAVLDWVGDDRDRAAKAIEAEKERDNPRSTLISKLKKLTES